MWSRKILKRIGVNDRRNIIHDRDKWRAAVMVAKTLVEKIKPKEEEEKIKSVNIYYLLFPKMTTSRALIVDTV